MTATSVGAIRRPAIGVQLRGWGWRERHHTPTMEGYQEGLTGKLLSVTGG
jgi:hypothetical protein